MGSADDDRQRKRRIADKLLVDFLEVECELQGTPFLKVTVTTGTASTFDMVVEKRRKIQRVAA